MLSWLPHGQEKLIKKRQKSGKVGVFEKKSGNLTKLKKRQTVLVQVYKIPCFLKPSNDKKIIKNPLKSD